MIVEINAIDAKTGKPTKSTIPEPPPSFFAFVGAFDLTDDKVKALIDRMNVSADTKAMLYSFSRATLKVGRSIIRIGRKIIDTLFSFMKNFPALSFGAIFGLIVGALIAAIPIVGVVLGPLATTLAVGLGVVLGGLKDMDRPDLGEHMRQFLDELRPLAPN